MCFAQFTPGTRGGTANNGQRQSRASSLLGGTTTGDPGLLGEFGALTSSGGGGSPGGGPGTSTPGTSGVVAERASQNVPGAGTGSRSATGRVAVPGSVEDALGLAAPAPGVGSTNLSVGTEAGRLRDIISSSISGTQFAFSGNVLGSSSLSPVPGSREEVEGSSGLSLIMGNLFEPQATAQAQAGVTQLFETAGLTAPTFEQVGGDPNAPFTLVPTPGQLNASISDVEAKILPLIAKAHDPLLSIIDDDGNLVTGIDARAKVLFSKAGIDLGAIDFRQRQTPSSADIIGAVEDLIGPRPGDPTGEYTNAQRKWDIAVINEAFDGLARYYFSRMLDNSFNSNLSDDSYRQNISRIRDDQARAIEDLERAGTVGP